MYDSLNSLKGFIQGIKWETTVGVSKGDTRSVDYSSYGTPRQALKKLQTAVLEFNVPFWRVLFLCAVAVP